MRLLLMALAGLLVGGAFAMRSQRRPAWVPLLFVVAAALLVWAAYSVEA